MACSATPPYSSARFPPKKPLRSSRPTSTHPRWRLIGFPTESRPLHDALWQKARAKDFAFRKIYDTRSAFTMTAQGVTKLATVNVKDFEGLGFRKVWNPLSG